MVLSRNLEKLYHKLITGNSSVDNDYLKNGFAPVEQEVVANDLVVEGALPSDVNGMADSHEMACGHGWACVYLTTLTLAGAFIRNGPNPLFTPIGGYHWFDGDGMCYNKQQHATSIEMPLHPTCTTTNAVALLPPRHGAHSAHEGWQGHLQLPLCAHQQAATGEEKWWAPVSQGD